jgi:50S ribosomal protein L16 3-hydroxylase
MENVPMNISDPLTLLGGLSPAVFMQRYWQKKPLLIRQAIPGFAPLLDRTALFALAARPEVESRLLLQPVAEIGQKWRLRHGPFARRSLPPLKQPAWTLLVQGVDLHDDRVHALMNQFRFIPAARLDDLMISFATDGGGVGPHFDNYDVFLLQAYGRRRWRIGRQKDLSLLPDKPVKILARFEPEQDVVLEAGDMLYLPPRYAHDGIAEGECMTYSVGFRVPARMELAQEVLQRIAEHALENLADTRFRDPKQSAVSQSARIPDQLLEFAAEAVAQAMRDPRVVARALGEVLSEPKASVCFESAAHRKKALAVRLDRRSRMLYDAHHIFLNGESYRASGVDARCMQTLANQRCLDAAKTRRLSPAARELLQDWCDAGWMHGGA